MGTNKGYPLSGVSNLPKASDVFPPFQIFPLFSEFLRVWEHFPTFHQKSMFHTRKLLMTFLVINCEFRISHKKMKLIGLNIYGLCLPIIILPRTLHFPPIWKNLLFAPTFLTSPDFVKFTCFCILYMFFILPYFDHDAFKHHTMHVLDAPVHCHPHTPAILILLQQKFCICRPQVTIRLCMVRCYY